MSGKRDCQLGSGLEAGVYTKDSAKGKAERNPSKTSDYQNDSSARLSAGKRVKGAGGKHKFA
jgi:hypothetical protein